jgi:hypothetical protein
MFKRLPSEIVLKIYEYDSTYRDHYTKEVIPQMRRFFCTLTELVLMDYVPDCRIGYRLNTFAKYSKKADLKSLCKYLGVVLPRKSTKWRISLRLLSALSGVSNQRR